jgi:RHS repeat-associated protein
LISDAGGTVTLEKSYTSFGEVFSESGSGESLYGYTGEVTDPSGLVFLRARYYLPGSGRFTSKDTWPGDPNHPLSFNWWSYGLNNPIIFTDPSGNVPLPILIAIIAFLSSLAPQLSGDTYNHDYINMTPEERQQDFEDSIGASLIAGTTVLTLGQGYIVFASVYQNSYLREGPYNSDTLYCRYCSKAELDAILKSDGYLRRGIPGRTYFISGEYLSSCEASNYLGLKASRPTIRVDFTILNNPEIYGPKSVKIVPDYYQLGGGIEYWSFEGILVRIINIIPLGK